MTNSTSDHTSGLPSFISHNANFLAGLLFVLQFGITLILGYMLHIAYLDSTVYSAIQNNGGVETIILGRDPLPHLLLALLVMLFALNAGWMICRLLAVRDTATDPEVLELHRRRRRRYTWLMIYIVFTGLVQFVTVAMRDVPQMKWESGSQIRYPLTWLPFAIVLLLLFIHLAHLAYIEVLERYDRRYHLNKRKYHIGNPSTVDLFTDDPDIQSSVSQSGRHSQTISQTKRKAN